MVSLGLALPVQLGAGGFPGAVAGGDDDGKAKRGITWLGFRVYLRGGGGGGAVEHQQNARQRSPAGWLRSGGNAWVCSVVGVVEVPLGKRHCWREGLTAVTAVRVGALQY